MATPYVEMELSNIPIPLKDEASTPDGQNNKRVKRFGAKEVTLEMVEKLKKSVEESKRQSCFGSIIHPDPTITDMDREHNTILRREYAILKSSYIRQETRKGRGCVGYVPEGACEQYGGRIRQFFLATCEHPRFDQFIMICILVNCVFLALTDPTVEVEPPYQVIAGHVFLAIFTIECLCKLIALSLLYFDDYWNWLDVVVVIEGWVSFATAGGGFLSGLKTLRILRPLRVANRLPALKKVITALLGSLPAIFNTFIVFFFFLLIFAMLCVMLWNGTFHYRCQNDITLEWVDEESLCYPAQPRADAVFCRSLQFLDSPYTCEENESCIEYSSTPEDGGLNFDNLGYSLLTLFVVTTMEGWSDVLFYTQDVMTQGTFFVFLAIILIGNFTIVNLMIAAILVQLDGAAQQEEREAVAAELVAAEEEELAELEARDAHAALVANVAEENARRRSLSSANGDDGDDIKDEVVPTFEEHLKEINNKKNKYSKYHFLDHLIELLSYLFHKVCYNGLKRYKDPNHFHNKLRWAFLDDASPFSYFIQGCILFNLVILAMDSHNIPKSTSRFLTKSNLSLTCIFCFEMAAKLFVAGVPEYCASKWNLFDGFIVIGSVLELIMAGGASSLGALRVVRMLRLTRVARLARLANKWKSLQGVLSLMVKSSKGMGPVLLLLVLFMFIFSILAMQMFGAAVTTDDYIRFDSFLVAFVQCFFVIIGEAWVQIMYVTMADTSPVSSIYFVLLIVIGSFILVNLILAVVLGDSMPNKIQMEVGLKQIDIIVNGYTIKCAMKKWIWYTDGKRTLEARYDCIEIWKEGRKKHGELIYNYSLHLGVGIHLIDEIKYYIDLPLEEPPNIINDDEGNKDDSRQQIAISELTKRRSSLLDSILPKSLRNSSDSPAVLASPTTSKSSSYANVPKNSVVPLDDSLGGTMVDTIGGDDHDKEEEKSASNQYQILDNDEKGKEDDNDNVFTDEDEARRQQEAVLMILAVASGEEIDVETVLDEGTWEALENSYQIIDSFIEDANVSNLESLSNVGPGMINDYKEKLFELFSNCAHGFTLMQKIELGLHTASTRNSILGSISGTAKPLSFRRDSVAGSRRGSSRSNSGPGSAIGTRLITAGAVVGGGGPKGTIKDRKKFVGANKHLLANNSDSDITGDRRSRFSDSIDIMSPPLPRTADDARKALFDSFNLQPKSTEYDADSSEDANNLSQQSPGQLVERRVGEMSSNGITCATSPSSSEEINRSSPSSSMHSNGGTPTTESKSFDFKVSHHDRYLNTHVSLLEKDHDVIVEGKWYRRWREYREKCLNIFHTAAWRDMILAAIIISSGIMLLPEKDTTYWSFWFVVDGICGLIFVVEVCVMVGAVEGKPKPPKHPEPRTGLIVYLEDPWNRLDLSIVIVTFLGPIFLETEITWAYAICKVVRSFRPLRIINRVDSLKYTVQTLYMSLMRLGTLILFLGFSMTAYAVVGMQLLKGLYYYCEDGDMADDEVYSDTVGAFPENAYRYGEKIGGSGENSEYYLTRPCEGRYINANGTELEALGEWRNPTFHFDDFPNSFLSVFVLSTEGWAEIVWYGLAATEIDYSSKPYYNSNLLVLFYFFFGVAFFGLYMLNLFIGVVFDQYNEMKAIKDDGHVLKKEEREWEEYRERLVFVKPIRVLPNPQAKWRVKCENIAMSPIFNRIVLGTIALNAVTLAVTHRGQSSQFTNVLEWSNVCFAMVFLVEFIMKISGHGVRNYISNSMDDFDAIVTLVSIVDSILFMTKSCTESDSAFLRFVRSMRVFRLMRLVNLIPGCEDILLACKFALPRLVNVCLLLSILVFFFANVGFVFFADIDNSYSGTYAYFGNVGSAMQLLFIIMTGDAWTDFMGAMIEEKPEKKGIIICYTLFYLVVQYFVVVNLFVMVVCEAFEVLSEDNRKRVEKLLPIFQRCWAKLDPHGKGIINASEIESLIRSLPEPFGVSYPENAASWQASYRKVRAKADFLRMQQLGHTGSDIKTDETVAFTGVMSGIIAVWLNEVGEIKMKGVQEQVQLLSASFLITTRAKAWAERTRKKIIEKRLADVGVSNVDAALVQRLTSTIQQRNSFQRGNLSQMNADLSSMNLFPHNSHRIMPSSDSHISPSSSPTNVNTLVPITPGNNANSMITPTPFVTPATPDQSSKNQLNTHTSDVVTPTPMNISDSNSPRSSTNSSLASTLTLNSINTTSHNVTPPITPRRPSGKPPENEPQHNSFQLTPTPSTNLEDEFNDNKDKTNERMLMKKTNTDLMLEPIQSEAQDLLMNSNSIDLYNRSQDKSSSSSSSSTNEGGGACRVDNLPLGWVIKMSKLYRTQFYYNTNTHVSSWYHPLDPRFSQTNDEKEI
jgi:hypothetical protein